MVSGHTLAAFIATCAVLVAVPGPNHLHIMGSSLAGSRLSGFAAAWGVETGLVLHIAVAATGLSVAIGQSERMLQVVRVAGAGYLAYLAVKSLRHHCRSGQGRDTMPPDHEHPVTGGGKVTPRRAFAAGVLITALNPKVVLLFAVIVPPFLDNSAGRVPMQVASLGLALLTLAIPFDMTYVLAGSVLAELFRRRPVILCYQQTLVGGVFLVLAVLTLPTSGWG